MKLPISKIPNILTISRIFVIPIFVLAFYLPSFWANIATTGIFLVAAITDYFDGWLARHTKTQSNFGKCLDPIADKLITAAAIVMIVHFSHEDLFITIPSIIILCREILISGMREFLVSLGEAMPVSRLAKYKTTLQMVAITGLLIGNSLFLMSLDFLSIIDPSLVKTLLLCWETLVRSLFLLAAALTLLTGYSYWQLAAKKI